MNSADRNLTLVADAANTDASISSLKTGNGVACSVTNNSRTFLKSERGFVNVKSQPDDAGSVTSTYSDAKKFIPFVMVLKATCAFLRFVESSFKRVVSYPLSLTLKTLST